MQDLRLKIKKKLIEQLDCYSLHFPDNSGFTLVEIIMIIVLLAVSIPVLVMMIGQDTRQSVNAEVHIAAANYGQALMEEIRSKRWDENSPVPPGNYTVPLGPEGGETRVACSGTPSTFDDVDDYNGYMETCDQYVKSVTVCYVNSFDLNTCVAGPTDYKRIAVNITSKNMATVELVTIMTNY